MMKNTDEKNSGFWKENGLHFLKIGLASMMLTVAGFVGVKLLFIYFLPGMEGSFLEMLIVSVLVAGVIILVSGYGFRTGLNKNKGEDYS